MASSQELINGKEITDHFASLPKARAHLDVHVYFSLDAEPTMQLVYRDLKAAFPACPIYDPVNRPIGPHPMPMFEFHISPKDAASVMQWLIVHGRGLRALVHPHTGDGLADHTRLARWVGEPLKLNVGIFQHA